jgi:hypothetical protein
VWTSSTKRTWSPPVHKVLARFEIAVHLIGVRLDLAVLESAK